MRYPSPKSVLTALATTGTSAVRLEALRLLELQVPEAWPPCPPRSRAPLLRKLIHDQKASSPTRLAAFKEIIFGLTINQQQELAAMKRKP